jgi:hypothetical protein
MGNAQSHICVRKKRSQLMRFFLDRHSGDKIVHPVFNAKFRIFVFLFKIEVPKIGLSFILCQVDVYSVF